MHCHGIVPAAAGFCTLSFVHSLLCVWRVFSFAFIGAILLAMHNRTSYILAHHFTLSMQFFVAVGVVLMMGQGGRLVCEWGQ